MTDEIMIIDDWVDALPEESHMIVFMRALSALGIPYTLKDDDIEPEFDHDALPDHDLVNAAMNAEYRKMYAAELTSTLVAKGAITPDRVDEQGNVIFVPVTDLD